MPDDENPKKKIYYYISYPMVVPVFDLMRIDEKKLKDIHNKNKRHFVIFLQKLFEGFDKKNTPDGQIAEKLKCPTNKVKEMKNRVEHIRF